DESATRGAFGIEPAQLVSNRVVLVKHALGLLSEDERIALLFHCEAADGNAVDALDSRGELVAPRHVVGGARRQNFDVAVSREVLRDVTGVELGAAVDCFTVSLDDDGELHCPPSLPGSPVSRAGS